MSNYNSIHTGAELDEAIGRVIDGGSVKVQVDANTTDIADLKERMTTADGVMTDTAEHLKDAEEDIQTNASDIASVQAQIDSIGVDLDDLKEIQDGLGSTDTYPFSSFLTDRSYWAIGTNASVGGTYSGAISTFTGTTQYYRQPTIIKLYAGWKIIISTNGGSGARGWAICSMANVILDVCPVNTSYIDSPYEYTATQECKVYVNTKDVPATISVVRPQTRLDEYLQDYADFKADTNEKFLDLNTALGKQKFYPFTAFTDGYYFWNIGGNAVVGDVYTGGITQYTTPNTFFRIPSIINLSAGDKIVLAVNGGNASRGWAICDLENVILDVCPVNTSYLSNPYEYTATQDCKVYANTKGEAGAVFIYYAEDTIKKMANTITIATPKIFNPSVDMVSRTPLRILDIGNSFSGDSMSYIEDLVTASGIDTSDFSLYNIIRGGGSFKTFYDSWHNQDDYSGEVGCHYTVRKVAGDIVSIEGETKLERMHYTFENVRWDVIVIHNRPYGSLSTSDWEGHGDNGYLKEFIRILRLYQPKATIGFMMPHASHRDSPDTVVGWQSIGETIRWMQTHYGVDFIVPVGTAIENLRASSLKTASVTHEFSRDDHHLGFGLARYVANATYFQTAIAPRFGISVYGNSAIHAVSESEMADPSYRYPDDCVDVTNANKGLAQICAICACDDMFAITPPDGIGDTL